MAFFYRCFVLSCLIILPFLSASAQENPTASLPQSEGADASSSEEQADEGDTDKFKEISPVRRWLDRTTFSFGGSVLLFQEDYGFDAAPVPILPAPSLAFMLPPLGNRLVGATLEFTLDTYFTHYKYSYGLDRPVPAEIENRSAFVLGPILALQAQGYIRVSIFRLRVSAGIAGDLRIILLAEDLNEADMDDANKQRDDIAAYFNRADRWLFPVVGVGMDFQATPNWAGGIDFRVWAPVDLIGMSENFLGWRFGIGFRVFRKSGFFETPAPPR
ncbi:MAG: hypothetical protein LBH18_00220 [Spirochaetaceae bacterium]|nr:hypothetical protein [Spirochaetaceae bacterium]